MKQPTGNEIKVKKYKKCRTFADVHKDPRVEYAQATRSCQITKVLVVLKDEFTFDSQLATIIQKIKTQGYADETDRPRHMDLDIQNFSYVWVYSVPDICYLMNNKVITNSKL